MAVAESRVTTRSRSKASMDAPESRVTTRINGTLSVPRSASTTQSKDKSWRTDDIAETCEVIWKKQPAEAFFRSKPFIYAVKSAALDMFVGEDKALRESVENHKNDDPKTTGPMMPKSLTFAAFKKWRSMTLTEQAPYLKKAAENYRKRMRLTKSRLGFVKLE